jgi:molybdenum cofactor cytidylyltransferase
MVILAGGAASRMGQSKADLPLDARGTTFLSLIVHNACSAGFPDIVIVVGAHRPARLPRDTRVRVVDNDRWQLGQLTSLQAGIDASSRAPIEAAAVSLVDAPLATPETMARVLRAWRELRPPIVRPARGDEHGHPVIFDASLFDELREADPAVGAKSVVRAHAGAILNVPIDDDGAYLDIDTPEDYARLRASR